MRLRRHRREHKTTLALAVRKIEVTRPTWELDAQGAYKTYHRTIRLTIAGGEVLEVYCSASFADELQLCSVKTLKPLTTSKQAKPIDWLQPKVYDELSEEEKDWLNKKYE